MHIGCVPHLKIHCSHALVLTRHDAHRHQALPSGLMATHSTRSCRLESKLRICPIRDSNLALFHDALCVARASPHPTLYRRMTLQGPTSRHNTTVQRRNLVVPVYVEVCPHCHNYHVMYPRHPRQSMGRWQKLKVASKCVAKFAVKIIIGTVLALWYNVSKTIAYFSFYRGEWWHDNEITVASHPRGRGLQSCSLEVCSQLSDVVRNCGDNKLHQTQFLQALLQ